MPLVYFVANSHSVVIKSITLMIIITLLHAGRDC